MKTKIYKSYEHFENRKDRTVNGVSPVFAKIYPDWGKMNNTNIGSWNCYNSELVQYSQDVNNSKDVYNSKYVNNSKNVNNSQDVYNSKVVNNSKNVNNSKDVYNSKVVYDSQDVNDSQDVYNSKVVYDSQDVYNSQDVYDSQDVNDSQKIYSSNSVRNGYFIFQKNDYTENYELKPIKDLHKKVYDYIKKYGLVMEYWHCGTVHCWAGTIVYVASLEDKNVLELEKKTSSLFTALQIIQSSKATPIPVPYFYDLDTKIGLERIKEYANKGK